MALTRKMLKAMGIDEDKIDQIMDAHTEVTDELKRQRDAYEVDAKKLPEVQKQLDSLKEAGGDEYEAKYNAEHQAFEDYKAQVAAEKAAAEKADLYRQFLLKSGVDEKRADAIIRVTDMGKIVVKDGKLQDQDKLSEDIKSIVGTTSVKTVGADVETPPADGGDSGEQDLGQMSMEDYIAARKKM